MYEWDLLPLTVPEVRRLLFRLVWCSVPSQALTLAWVHFKLLEGVRQ